MAEQKDGKCKPRRVSLGTLSASLPEHWPVLRYSSFWLKPVSVRISVLATVVS